MKTFNCSYAAILMLIAVIATVFPSCVNEEYDIEDLNTEITIAGEGLSLPLGSTKQMTLSSLLSDMDDDMLQVLDGGAYALRINDILNLGDRMPDMTDMLNIPDVDFEQTMQYSLSGIDAESMSIGKQEFTYEFGLVDEGVVPEVILPEINVEHVDKTGVWEYGKAAREMEIEVDDVHVSTKSLFSLPGDVDRDATEDISLGDFPEAEVDPVTTKVIVKSESPEGISNISDVMMSGTSLIKVSLSLENSFISDGDVMPDLTLDLGGLLILEGDRESIDIDDDFRLNAGNGYTASQTYRVKEVVVNEEDWNGSELKIEKFLTVSGTSALKNAIADADLVGIHYGGMKLKVDVEFVDFMVESIMMDVEERSVKDVMEIPVTLDEMVLPDGVRSIDVITFKENSKLDLIIDLENLSDIEGIETMLETLVMTFPEDMTVREAVDGKVTMNDLVLSPHNDIEIHIDEIKLPAPEDGKISYEAIVKVEVLMTAGGRICSAHVPYTEEEDGAFVVDAESHFELDDYILQLEGFTHELAMEPEELTYDLPDAVSDIGTFTVIPDGDPVLTVFIGLPDTDVPVTAGKDGLRMYFPEFLRFKDVADAYGFDPETNSILLAGELPEAVRMPIDKLVVVPELDAETGRYSSGGEIKVDGTVMVRDGQFLGSDIEEIAGTSASVVAVIPDINASELVLDRFEIGMNEVLDLVILEAGGLPDEVKDISVVDLADVDLVMDVMIENLPAGLDADLTADFVLTMPEILVLDETDARVDGNVVTIRSGIKDGRIEVDPVRIKAIDLSDADLYSEDDLIGRISIDGVLSAEDPDFDIEELDGDISINMAAGIKDIVIDRIMAKVEYDIEGIEESFRLSGLPDFMSGDDFVLDLVNPHLILKVKTNMGVPVSGNLCVIPVVGGNEVETNKIEARMDLPYTETSAVTGSIVLWFGSNPDLCPKDYTFVEADINRLIAKIPDELKITLDAASSSDTECVVEPSADYVLDVEYDFVIPMEFGEDLNIVVRDTLSGLPDIMKELLEKNVVQLGGSVESSLPLCLELDVRLLDAAGNPVPMEKEAVQNISSCNSDGSPAVTPLDLMLDLKEGTAVSGIDAIELSFRVTAPSFTGIPVSEDDYVRADLKVILPEGLTIDIADLNSEENR